MSSLLFKKRFRNAGSALKPESGGSRLGSTVESALPQASAVAQCYGGATLAARGRAGNQRVTGRYPSRGEKTMPRIGG